MYIYIGDMFHKSLTVEVSLAEERKDKERSRELKWISTYCVNIICIYISSHTVYLYRDG